MTLYIILRIVLLKEQYYSIQQEAIMTFTTGTEVLDAIVLAIVARETEGTYGYKITQDVRNVLDVSESALYPVLRRLQTNNLLETYDRSFSGRNRRYYKITSQGMIQLDSYRRDWIDNRRKMNSIMLGEET